jgi:hypothetical protein
MSIIEIVVKMELQYQYVEDRLEAGFFYFRLMLCKYFGMNGKHFAIRGHAVRIFHGTYFQRSLRSPLSAA